MPINDNILKRIRSLIALSTDLSTTESERTLALKRAQELMARYSVSLTDESETPTVVDFLLKRSNPLGMSTYTYCHIASIIGQNFGCYAFMRRYESTVSLMGFPINCDIASYAIDSLINQGISDMRSGNSYRSSGYYIQFWKGFTEGLIEKYSNKLTNENALVLYDKVKEEYQRRITTIINKPSQGSGSSGFSSGIKSARESSLNAGIKESSQRRIE